MLIGILFLALFLLVFIALIFYLSYFLKIRLPANESKLVFDFPKKPKTEYANAKKIREKAYVFCSNQKEFKKIESQYAGYEDCHLFKKYHASDMPCSWACIGFGTCIPHCPQEAISIVNKTAVIHDNCDGCGKCIDICPNNVIRLIPNNNDYVVACSSHDGENTHCSKACTGCELCIDHSYYSGFKMKDLLAISDYETNPNKSEYAEKCPQNTIVKIAFPRKNDFKFLSFWYIIRTIMSKKNNEN